MRESRGGVVAGALAARGGAAAAAKMAVEAAPAAAAADSAPTGDASGVSSVGDTAGARGAAGTWEPAGGSGVVAARAASDGSVNFTGGADAAVVAVGAVGAAGGGSATSNGPAGGSAGSAAYVLCRVLFHCLWQWATRHPAFSPGPAWRALLSFADQWLAFVPLCESGLKTRALRNAEAIARLAAAGRGIAVIAGAEGGAAGGGAAAVASGAPVAGAAVAGAAAAGSAVAGSATAIFASAAGVSPAIFPFATRILQRLEVLNLLLEIAGVLLLARVAAEFRDSAHFSCVTHYNREERDAAPEAESARRENAVFGDGGGGNEGGDAAGGAEGGAEGGVAALGSSGEMKTRQVAAPAKPAEPVTEGPAEPATAKPAEPATEKPALPELGSLAHPSKPASPPPAEPSSAKPSPAPPSPAPRFTAQQLAAPALLSPSAIFAVFGAAAPLLELGASRGLHSLHFFAHCVMLTGACRALIFPAAAVAAGAALFLVDASLHPLGLAGAALAAHVALWRRRTAEDSPFAPLSAGAAAAVFAAALAPTAAVAAAAPAAFARVARRLPAEPALGLGIQWYLAWLAFPYVRELYGLAFQLAAAVLLPAVALRFAKLPLATLQIGLGCYVVLKEEPTLLDLLLFAVGGLGPRAEAPPAALPPAEVVLRLDRVVAARMPALPFLTAVSVFSMWLVFPLTAQMWLVRGAGNPNFVYVAQLAFTAAGSLAVIGLAAEALRSRAADDGVEEEEGGEVESEGQK